MFLQRLTKSQTEGQFKKFVKLLKQRKSHLPLSRIMQSIILVPRVLTMLGIKVIISRITGFLKLGYKSLLIIRFCPSLVKVPMSRLRRVSAVIDEECSKLRLHLQKKNGSNHASNHVVFQSFHLYFFCQCIVKLWTCLFWNNNHNEINMHILNKPILHSYFISSVSKYCSSKIKRELCK